MEEEKVRNLKLGERGAIISIVAYIILSILKLIVGYMTDSHALKADGLNNATDIIASIAVLIGLKISQKPADENHRYGHWKSETIASLVASFIIMTVGLQVLLEASKSIFESTKETPDLSAAMVGLFSAGVMVLVYVYNKKLANKINSKSVMATAKDNLSDAFVSIGTTIGIFASQFGFPLLDTLTAMLIGLIICKTAWEIFRESSHELSDGFDEEKIVFYGDVIQHLEGVVQVKEIKGRNYGNNEIIDVVIMVEDTLSLKEAHDIATCVEQTLMEQHDVYDVHVHVEPR